MKTDIWMPIYIGDYLADTSRLTTEQHGAYLLLLMDYWRKGPLPNSPAVLAQITKMSPDAWSNAQAILMDFFELKEDGKLHQKRADAELELALKNRSSRAEKARKAAKARWKSGNDAPSIPLSNAPSMPESCPSPSPSPSPKRQIQKPSRDKREDQAAPFFSEVKDLIFRYYRSKNDGRDPEWDGAEGKQLSKLLKANPAATIDHWTQCLANRHRSEVTHGERPMLWLSRLSSFGNCPLNEFKNPMKVTNGTTSNRSKAKSDGTAEALYRSLEKESDQAAAWEAGSETTDADRGGGFQDIQRRPFALPA